MKRSHPFRFEKRLTKRGNVYYVRYDADPARPKSTGVLVSPRDRKSNHEPAGLNDAIAWAYAYMDEAAPRKALPTIGECWAENAVDPVKLGIIVQVSVDGGATWPYDRIQKYNEPNECAITFAGNDLNAFIPDPLNYPSETFVTAYIKGLLRVRVLANIESDDAVVAVAPYRSSSPLQFIVTDHVSRRGQFRRQLRYANTPTGLAANSVLPGDGIALPLNVDDEPEAERLGIRLRNELEGRRVNGRVSIPYLLRDGAGPWLGYRIGDELLGIKTQDESTFVSLRGSSDPSKPAARIVAITYTYRDEPSERSTTLHIEDPGFEDTEYLPGDPRPRSSRDVLSTLMTGFLGMT